MCICVCCTCVCGVCSTLCGCVVSVTVDSYLVGSQEEGTSYPVSCRHHHVPQEVGNHAQMCVFLFVYLYLFIHLYAVVCLCAFVHLFICVC